MNRPPEPEPHKRKRDPEETAIVQPAMPPLQAPLQAPLPHQGGNTGFVNYLSTSLTERLALLPGDPDTFAEIVRILGNYEGVWERNESFAACLGAKLSGPRLLRGFDKFFEGPIKTNPHQGFTQPVNWLDICNFAKENPQEFTLTTLPDGSRCSQFVCKGFQVEITEDDWRFISSGALSRLPLEHPLEEDETAELATLDILEQRASTLWRRADEVAARARILHHKLGQRRQEILRRRNENHDDVNNGGSGFHSVNHHHTARPPSRGPSYDLHADLLQQFLAVSESLRVSRSTSGTGLSQGRESPAITGGPQHQQQHQPQRLSLAGRPAGAAAEDDHQADTFRPLIVQRIDRLVRGDLIQPPCDRCRRLRLQCVKHLTACQGCTKKHAKCSWKTVSDDEAAQLRREMGFDGPSEADIEMATPESRGLDLASGSVASADSSRPASRAGGASEPAGGVPPAADRYTFLPSPTSRIELPPMRLRANLGLAQNSGQGSGVRAGTPQSVSSTSQFGGEKGGFVGSQPPSR